MPGHPRLQLNKVSKTWMPGTSPGMTKRKTWTPRPGHEIALAVADLLRRASEQQQVPVRVLHNKISRAPGLALERLEKRHAGGLKLEEQLLDLRRRSNRERGGQQFLAVSYDGIDHRLLDASQVDQCGIAPDLRIERRLAIGERDGEAELAGEEIARQLDVGDKQLRFGT